MGFKKIIFNKMHLKLAHRRLLFYLFISNEIDVTRIRTSPIKTVILWLLSFFLPFHVTSLKNGINTNPVMLFK